MPFLGEISALLTATFWSGSSLAFAAAIRRVGSVQVNVTRQLLAATILVTVVLVAGLGMNLTPSQVAYLAVSGVIGFAVGDTFLFQAFQALGARVSMLIMSLAPAVSAALAYMLLGEDLSLAAFGGIALTIAGICFVIMERSDVDDDAAVHKITPAGIALAVVAAAGQGSGLVFAKMAFRDGPVNGFVATLVRISASLVVLLPIAVLTGKYRHPFEPYLRDPRAFSLTLLGAVFGPVLGVVGSLIAIQYTHVGIAATLMATTPVIMLPLVHIIHRERLGWRAFAGTATAVAGVAVLFLR
jgi:drug/metabolite transporter (DMT)-like permease